MLKCFLKPGFLVFLLSASYACTYRVTEPPRTASEQFLLSHAAIHAVKPLDLRPLGGKSVYLDATYFKSIDQEFVIGEIRTKLLMAGAQLAAKKEDAEIVCEIRTPGVGVDRKELLIGIPELGFPVSAGQVVALPEIALFKVLQQTGHAGVGVMAYDRATSRAVCSVGPTFGASRRTDWTFLIVMFTTTRNMPF